MIDLTEAELEDIRRDADFTSRHVGALNSPVRVRAENIMRLVSDYKLAREKARALDDIRRIANMFPEDA